MEPFRILTSYILWGIVVVVYRASICQAQFLVSPSPEEKLVQAGVDTSDVNELIGTVASADIPLSSSASLFLAKRQVSAAIPVIKERYQREGVYDGITLRYLNALSGLGDSDARNLLRSFADIVFSRGDTDDYRTYWEALVAAELLVHQGDFSTYEIITAAFASMDSNIPGGFVDLLARFGQADELRPRVATLLAQLARNHTSDGVRWHAVKNLDSYIDFPETHATLRTSAEYDSDYHVRYQSTLTLLRKYNDPLAVELLRRAALTSADTVESTVAIDRLKELDDPIVLVTFEEAAKQNPNQLTRNWAKFASIEYVPPRPPASKPVSELLLNLVTTKHRTASLVWIADAGLITELDNHLENAQKHLERGDEKNASRQVAKFQEKVDFWRGKTEEDEKAGKPRGKRFVTIEGWKFLHHHAQYILDRLPGK